MAPAAADSNWLNFSLSSMEMLATTSQSPHHPLLSSSSSPPPPPPPTLYHHQPAPPSQHFLLDSFYPNEWMINSPAGTEQGQGMMGPGYQQQTVPKLEDFLGGDTASTQDSSTLTHIYDNSLAYLNEISLPGTAGGGFQAFSTNSGSEVDDSQIACAEFAGQAIDSHHFASQAQPLSLAAPQAQAQPIPNHQPDAPIPKKVADTFGQRTSIYRGVTRHRWTGRYEAHLWDNSCRREGQARKGRQVYLGGYDKEDKAARAYDLAALKYWGPSATTNFPITTYSKEIEEMKNMTKQEFIASLRRKSSGFSRGASIYRGVTRHHQQGRWQARIGRVAGNKDLYLGTFATEEEAAEAYDIAAIKFRGVNAVTNFEMNRYDVEAILKSALPVGGAAKRLKVSSDEQKPVLSLEYHQQQPQEQQQLHQGGGGASINFGSAIQQQQSLPYALPLDAAAASYYQQQQQQGYFQHLHPTNPLPSDTPMGFVPPPSQFYLWPHHPY